MPHTSTPGRREAVLVRSATAEDARVIHRLIARHAAEGHVLARTLAELTAHAERFLVATSRGRIVGCAELAPLSAGLAEIRSFVVTARSRGRGLGRLMVEELRSRAARRDFEQLCAFAHSPSYFSRLGFSPVPHASLPEKIATDCCRCALVDRCGQSAMVLDLESAADYPPLAPEERVSERP